MPEAAKNTQKPTDYSLELKNKKTLQFIEDVTSNADEVQKKVLEEILSRNAHVEYLQRHGLNGQTDRETFKKFMPVIAYEDIQPHIDRIADGDTSPILCSRPISEFLTRSGYENETTIFSIHVKFQFFFPVFLMACFLCSKAISKFLFFMYKNDFFDF